MSAHRRTRPIRLYPWALLLLVWASPALAQAPDSLPPTLHPATGHVSPPRQPLFFGPLTTEEGAPLQRVSYTHTVEGADLIEAGSLQAEMWMGYANIFEQDSSETHELFLDLERLSTNAGVRFGVHPRLEVGGRLSFETTGGGFLDSFISGWHTTLGLGNGNREKYPHGEYAQRLRDRNGDLRLDVPRRTMALVDTRLFAKWSAWGSQDGRKLVSLRGVVRVPAQDELSGTRRADAALMALGRISGDRWHLYGTVGGATVRAAQDVDGLLRDGSFFVDVAVERTLTHWVSGVVQLSTASPRLKGFQDPELDGWPVNFVFGVAGEVRGWRVDVSFQEDIPPNTPAVDFTLGIGVRRTW